MTTDNSIVYGTSGQGSDMVSLGPGMLSASLYSERPLLAQDGNRFQWTDHARYTGFSKLQVTLDEVFELLTLPAVMRNVIIDIDAHGKAYIEVKHKNHTYRLTSTHEPVPDNFSLDQKTRTFQMMVDVSRTALASRL